MIKTLQYKNGLLIITKTSKFNDFVWIPFIKNKTLSVHKLILNNIKTSLAPLKQWFFIDGFGFRTQYIRGKILFKIGFSHLIYVKIPNTIGIGRYLKLTPSKRGLSKKKLLYIIGFNFTIFQQFINAIASIRKPSVYREKGVYFTNLLLKFKKTKKKTKGKF